MIPAAQPPGLWHGLTITETPDAVDYDLDHPDGCPVPCPLDQRARYLGLDRDCAGLTPGVYRIRRWARGVDIETPDGRPVPYRDDPSSAPQLSVRMHADGLSAVLRADGIRRDTLIALAAAYTDNPGLVGQLLYDLASADEGGIVHAADAIALDVEAACGMDDAEIRLDTATTTRLAAETGRAARKLTPRYDAAA